LLTHINRVKRELSPGLPVGIVGDTDAAGFRDAFQPRRDIDPITENVALIDDDIAEIDPDPELDDFVRWHRAVARGHAVLNCGGAAHGIDDACEFHEQAIACCFDDPAAILANFWIDKLAPVGLKLCERAFLVGSHKPTVSCHVRRHDRG
jgi:hypothetical protein